METITRHIPVLYQEALDFLRVEPVRCMWTPPWEALATPGAFWNGGGWSWGWTKTPRP